MPVADHAFSGAANALSHLRGVRLEGRIVTVTPQYIEATGLAQHTTLGDRVRVCTNSGQEIVCEVIAVSDGRIRIMPLDAAAGVGPGATVVAEILSTAAGLAVCDQWLGRVIDPLGRPLDNRGELRLGGRRRPVRAQPPQATLRGRLGPTLSLGVKALDLFTPCLTGQRLGIFAGSGVGKSTLLGMLARFAQCDVVVLALVGERGREVREFLEDELGADGLRRAVVVVATSDATPILRREATYTAMTVAEHFRDAGHNVLLLLDSITRFCHALREIALSAGERQASRGFPASVFAELPCVLERAGPGAADPPGAGCITAFFTVLVEGDDLNEPITDAVRGTLDGHIILSRKIADAGRYPAIDVLRSVSRSARSAYSHDEARIISRARTLLATFDEVFDLVRLGAYQKGNDAAVDEAITMAPRIEELLRQSSEFWQDRAASFQMLGQMLGKMLQAN